MAPKSQVFLLLIPKRDVSAKSDAVVLDSIMTIRQVGDTIPIMKDGSMDIPSMS